MKFGIEMTDRGYAEIEAATLTEAWVMANRQYFHLDKHYNVVPDVYVVFTLEGRYQQAVRLDYSTTTGMGDPH